MAKALHKRKDSFFTSLVFILSAFLVLFTLGGAYFNTCYNSGESFCLYSSSKKQEQAQQAQQTPQDTQLQEAFIKEPLASFQADYSVEYGPFFNVFIVLDDAGASLEQMQQFYEFAEVEKLTIAILPHLKYSNTIAETLYQSGIPYILHMPMEPLGTQNPGEFALLVEHSKEKIDELIRKNIESIPHIIGVNNHMGSYATSDATLMQALLSHIRERKLFFMDSFTTADSIAKKEAENIQVPFLRRDVFLDNQADVEYITMQFKNAIEIAKRKALLLP